jgi:hypothetical protein
VFSILHGWMHRRTDGRAGVATSDG